MKEDKTLLWNFEQVVMPTSKINLPLRADQLEHYASCNSRGFEDHQIVVVILRSSFSMIPTK